MAKLSKHLALMALLAGTALATTPTTVSAQSGTDAVDQSQNMDQSNDGGNSDELLLKKQNDANSGEQTTMPDAEQQDQAVTDEAQDPASQNQDQATEEELLKQKNQSEDQAQSPSRETETEDQATDENLRKQKSQTEDQAQSPSDDTNEDTATDTTKKKTDETASDSETKVDKNSDQAASEKPSNETTGSINISAEQKTVIKNTIVETNVKPVDIDFKVSIGVSVPKTIEFHPLPPKIVEIVPAYREYVYFIVADGTIVIVDPDSYEVVYIISA